MLWRLVMDRPLREDEIAGVLSFIKHGGVSNVVWLTADMHYTAAHYCDPNKSVFQDFEPFWEFVSGPLHAGTWSPGQLDNTFGPIAMFAKGATPNRVTVLHHVMVCNSSVTSRSTARARRHDSHAARC